jgi:hypothetical protein
MRPVVALNEFYFDTVIEPMSRAGADVNAGRERALQVVVKSLNAPIVERLMRDGASAKFSIGSCNGHQGTLYALLIPNIGVHDPSGLLRIVTALSRNGLSPMQKTAYVIMGGYGQCQVKSLYDAAVDAGNLTLASQIKEAAQVSATPSAPKTSSSIAAVPLSSQHFGEWTVGPDSNGKPVASTAVVARMTSRARRDACNVARQKSGVDEVCCEFDVDAPARHIPGKLVVHPKGLHHE